jgi:hypothetical protein
VSTLAVVALVAAILLVWFLGALVVGLAVGRILGASPRAPRRSRSEYDRAA